MYMFRPRGVCAQAIGIELNGNTIEHVEFMGGCNGNLKAISKIIQGMTIDQVASAFEGNTCGPRSTSCADQLVKGLREAYDAQNA